MSTMTANWAVGDPDEFCKQFISVVGDARHSMGKRCYNNLLMAIAYASAYNVVAAGAPDSSAKLQNILATVKAVFAAGDRQAQQRMLDDEDEDDEDEDKIDDPEQHLVYEGDEGLPASADLPVPIQHLAAFITQITSSRSPAQPQGQHSPTADAVEGENGLALPLVIVQQIIRCLDGRSAAAAALSCKQLAAAHKLNHNLEIPAALKAYCLRVLEAMSGPHAEYSDGSAESEFTAKWPLDGSAAAGVDMLKLVAKMSIRNLLPAFQLPEGAILPARDPKSTPLAMFMNSKPVPLYTSRAATADPADTAKEDDLPEPVDMEERAARLAAVLGGNMPSRPRGNAPARSIPAAPLPAADTLTAACCDVQRLSGIEQGAPIHIDGDLLTNAYATGWKERDPGLGAAVLGVGKGRNGEYKGLVYDETQYDHGLFSYVTQVCSDAGNALVWCAADDGRRVKAFRAPDNLGGPKNADATCNNGERNGMRLQYTFCTDVNGVQGGHAGLHVLGTKVFAANSAGALFSWDIAELPTQAKQRISDKALEESGDDSDEGDEPRFKGSIGWRDTDDPSELEVSRGTLPQSIYLLQRPQGCYSISQTCLLNSRNTASRTLVAACSLGTVNDVIVTYDMHTQQAKNLFLGHLYSITDIAAAPEAWPGAENLFATSAKSGDVKLWDVRCRHGAAAVTLAGEGAVMAVTLANNTGCSTGSGGQAAASSSSSNQLGAGMLCFAGGAGECVWAWDLRQSSAQALYQLSTGNLTVDALVWHEGSSSLIASCDSLYENRFGGCYREDFLKVGQRDNRIATLLGMMAPMFGFGDISHLMPGSDSNSDNEDLEEEPRYWPRNAKHKSEDFRAHFSSANTCVLAYTFTDKASQKVPESQEPYFENDGGGVFW